MNSNTDSEYRRSRGIASGIPLGGLGTGSVEIREDGRFHDWEIFNNYLWSGNPEEPGPEMASEDAFFALRYQQGDMTPRVRLLYDDDKTSRGADTHYRHAIMYNYPFVRNITDITYTARHPFARLIYREENSPLDIEMEAWSPFVPLNAKDSGLPLAFFHITVKNTGGEPCDVSLLFSLRNCAGYEKERNTLVHRVERTDDATAIIMGCDGAGPDERTNGGTAVAVLDGRASVLPAWTDGHGRMGYEGAATPAMSQLFYPFRDTGELTGGEDPWQQNIEREKTKREPGILHFHKIQAGFRWRGAVCSKATLAPGEERNTVFVMSWHFSNHYHYYSKKTYLGHMYENWFQDVGGVLRYGVEEHDRLYRQSRLFCDNLYDGTLEPWFAGSLNAQLTTFPQSFWWTKAGDLAAWEGSACCQIIPAALTPWSSVQPLLFFPQEYFAMRRKMVADFENGHCDTISANGSDECCCCSPDGGFATGELERRNAADGTRRDRFGGWFAKRFQGLGYTEEEIRELREGRPSMPFSTEAGAVQVFRDYQWGGNMEYLKTMWPYVKLGLEAQMILDHDNDGLLDGAISFMTYDHWWVPALNCYRNTMWLAELRAGVEIASLVGDVQIAAKLGDLVERGKKRFDEKLWNGEYYDLCYDQKLDRNDLGCLADQVSGHLFLRLSGLDPVHPQDNVVSALRSVHRYNLKEEEGLLNGCDPKGPREDWRYFARFSTTGEDEALAGQWVTPWTGTEYYVAACMIGEGLVEEGFAVAKNVWDRHVQMGMVFNHIECGQHYFRAMAVWHMLPALQGLVCDTESHTITFAPKWQQDDFDTILIIPGAWGRIRQHRDGGGQTDEILLHDGNYAFKRITLEIPEVWRTQPLRVATRAGNESVGITWEREGDRISVELIDELELRPGTSLLLRIWP